MESPLKKSVNPLAMGRAFLKRPLFFDLVKSFLQSPSTTPSPPVTDPWSMTSDALINLLAPPFSMQFLFTDLAEQTRNDVQAASSHPAVWEPPLSPAQPIITRRGRPKLTHRRQSPNSRSMKRPRVGRMANSSPVTGAIPKKKPKRSAREMVRLYGQVLKDNVAAVRRVAKARAKLLADFSHVLNLEDYCSLLRLCGDNAERDVIKDTVRVLFLRGEAKATADETPSKRKQVL